MSETTNRHFGLVIAYLLPGFVALAGIAPLSPAVAGWLAAGQGVNVGTPLYTLLAATALGLLASCFRWLILDRIHGWSGVPRPAWDDRQLASTLGSFDYLVQSHFRYYEFCGNSLIAGLFTYGLNRAIKTLPFLGVGTDLGMLVILAVLFAASRDALAKYYRRTSRLVGPVAEKDAPGAMMFNGNDHPGGSASPKPQPQPKPQTQPPPGPSVPAKPSHDGSDRQAAK